MLQENIDALLRLIDAIVESIAREESEKTDILLRDMPPLLNRVFPIIVQSYLMEELAEYKEDMNYWVQQLERIIRVMQEKDLFALIDVLYYETKENLLLYVDMIKKAGIAL